MDWVLNHLQLIIAAAGAVAWWLNQRRLAQSGSDVNQPKETEKTFSDPELAERTRRIREEIQRKIEQRTRGYSPPPATVPAHEVVIPPPLIRGMPRPQSQPTPMAKPVAVTSLEAQRTAEILEQQATIAERLRQASELKAAALRRVQFENQVSSEQTAIAIASTALHEDLKSPDALRRAFILREIIGPPVALR